MKIRGRVTRGVGESPGFLSIDWVDEQLCEKLEFHPYRGTLNLVLEEANIQRVLREKGRDRIVAREQGFCDAVLVKGRINDLYECGVVIPLVDKYDEKLLEVVAPVHLKGALKIDDGDEVTLNLDIEAVPE